MSYNAAETNLSLKELYKWKPENHKNEVSSEAAQKKKEIKNKKKTNEKVLVDIPINKDDIISEATAYLPSELKTLIQWSKSDGDFLQEHFDFLKMCIVKLETNKTLNYAQASVLLEIIEQAKSKGLKYQKRGKGFYWPKKSFWHNFLPGRF